MKKPDRALYEIAHRVMKAHRTAASNDAAGAMQRACGALYQVLETAMGPAGLEALIGRAIQIASRDYPWLSSVEPAPAADCPLAGLAEAAEGIDGEEAAEGFAALLATLLWLLITFIGEDLTLRFVAHAWPAVSFKKVSEGVQA